MRRISSRLTLLYKRIFPIAWFGILAAIVWTGFSVGTEDVWLLPRFLLALGSLFAVFGYVAFRMFVFPLADQVWDDGDALLITRGPIEARIPLSQIAEVTYFPLTGPERVRLSLSVPSALGSRISFALPVRLNVFSQSPIVQELKCRVALGPALR